MGVARLVFEGSTHYIGWSVVRQKEAESLNGQLLFAKLVTCSEIKRVPRKETRGSHLSRLLPKQKFL
jgi:hypothetical protein